MSNYIEFRNVKKIYKMGEVNIEALSGVDFTIDKGSADGIKVNCNVLAGSGLVGLVTEVGPHYARVRSIIDNSSNVSAMILSTSDTCIVRGDLKLMDDGRLRFEKPNNQLCLINQSLLDSCLFFVEAILLIKEGELYVPSK